MVARIFILFALISQCSFGAARLLLEMSKQQFYSGEQIGVNFILYSLDDSLEVEVVKFPEFRGFWSENLILRQGPIQLIPAFMQALTFPRSVAPSPKVPNDLATQRRAVIGSYLLSSLVGKKEVKIEPMRLLVRRRQGGQVQEVELTSEMPTYDVLPLPSVPHGENALSFIGGIGNFRIDLDSNQVLYRENEPTVLRINLQGEGNFSEISRLPIDFPSAIEVLSKRAVIQGSGNFALKTFEYTVTVHDTKEVVLPEQRLLYFQPSLKKYLPLTIPPVRFTYSPPPVAPEGPQPLLFAPETEWTSYLSVWDIPGFTLSQIALLCFVVWSFIFKTVRFWVTRYRLNPRRQRIQAWKQAIKAHEGTEALLRSGTDMLLQALPKSTGNRPLFSTREKLETLRSTLDPEVLRQIQSVLHAFEEAHYSPRKTSPLSADQIKTQMELILKRVS